MTYQTGDLVPTSGLYQAIERDVTQRIALAAGERFPPVMGRQAVFRLERPVVAKFTSVTSAPIIDEISTEFSAALKRLATK
jgi:hypothetical protein